MTAASLWGAPASDEVKRVLEAAGGNVERHKVLHMMTKASRQLGGADRDKLNSYVYELLERRKSTSEEN